MHAQDKAALQHKYDKLQEEIHNAQDLLDQTRQNKKSSLNSLNILNRKMDIRRQAMDNLSAQMALIDMSMAETQQSIKKMQKDLGDMKQQYAKMICAAYVNDRNYKPLHFIFSAKNVNEAFRQIEYMKAFNDFRKDQISAINEVRENLEEKLEIIKKNKSDKQDLIAKEKEEQDKLAGEKAQQDENLKSLQSKEKQLAGQIDRKKKDAADLNKKIQSIIAEEIRKEKEAAAKQNTAKNDGSHAASATSEVPELTPEMKLISKNFEDNRGRLPWPVERGTVTGQFGKHPHPVLKDVVVENNGIDIATQEGASVRCIFDGEVVNVIFNPSFQKGVIIKHGSYYSVYTNLESVNVKPGEKVRAKEKIGTVYTDEDEGKTEVHLEIWDGTTLMDPSLWISK